MNISVENTGQSFATLGSRKLFIKRGLPCQNVFEKEGIAGKKCVIIVLHTDRTRLLEKYH